ncbi:hypothetical protein GCM10010347_09310 [Streptomyces cirratus]|uniref:Uncharacterized protein n=2 Tax=Streptomyces cirratus TaxID=68187 RepID=A0ABQ3EN92_9ACTN|nr:hypothetical protein GCM10010347_09310 [Streptomyces cirratus]
MSTRVFRRNRTLTAMAPMVTAVLAGGLLMAAPASAAPPVGTVSFSGKVTCKSAFPAPNNSVPTRVSLDSDEDDASGPTNNPTNRRATFGPISLDVPLDSKFSLTVDVTCKAPGKKAQQFTRTIAQDSLTEGDTVPLNIK